jgi:hypothetical protein
VSRGLGEEKVPKLQFKAYNDYIEVNDDYYSLLAPKLKSKPRAAGFAFSSQVNVTQASRSSMTDPGIFSVAEAILAR